MAKIVPAITSLSYLVANGVSYIDLARDLSRVNRRLYRQGRNYAIESVSVTCPGAGMKQTDVLILGLYGMGNSWTVHNAWTKAFEAYRKEQKKVTDVLGNVQGKWSDFKIYLDDSHEDGTTVDVIAGDTAAVSSGEWVYSKFVFDDDGTERELACHMIGSTNLADTNNESGIGLIDQYQRSRAIIQSPNPLLDSGASDTIFAKLLGTDELTDMVVDNLESDNDNSPYDPDDYYGGDTNGDAAHLERIFAVSPTEFTRTVPGFIAPCGLVRVATEELQLDASSPPIYESTSAPTAMVTFRLVPGPYKGVLAPPMGQ